MERKLISSNGLLLKTILVFALLAFFAYDLVPLMQHGVQRREFIAALILFPALGLASWWAFSAAHPVYFDRGFLYYSQYGKKYRVACEEINSVSVVSAIGNKHCKLKFYTSRKKVSTIHFLLLSDETTPHPLLQQLENIIRQTKPAFEIDGLR